jgi:CRP-like cAMP-binding protein
VAVLATDAQGREQQIEILEDGDHFGEMALLQDKPRSASIRTLTPCVVISLSRHRFKRLVERFPAMQPAIERRMARSVENLTSLQQSSSAAS